MDEQRYRELKENYRLSEVPEDEQDEFAKMREELEEEEIPEPEIEKITMDTWRCKRCGAEFERERGEIPFECDGCGKTSNKTAFRAYTGPYQYFDLHGRKRFVPKKLAEGIMETEDFITRKDSKEIYCWEDNCYQLGAEDFIRNKAQELLDDESVRNRKEEVIGYIRDDNLVEPEEIDKEDNLIAVDNGILNTTEGELIDEPDPEQHYITQKLPVKYDPEINFENSEIKSFMEEIFYKDDFRTIKRYLGTMLLKNYDFKKALVLRGPSNSGKSTFLDLVKRFLGDENVSEQTLQRIADYPFSKENLMGKLANIRADLSTKEIKNVGLIKELTGGDTINAPQKHIQGDKSFSNFAKLVFSCNKLPHLRVAELTDAFWNRWITITVDKNIFDPKDPDTIRKEELMRMLTTEEEMSALLNWALEGLEELITLGNFSLSDRSLNGKERWIADTDNLRAFVNRFIERDSEGRIVKDEFYHAYTDHCDRKDWNPEKPESVGKKLPTIEGSVKAKRPKIHYDDSHKQIRCWEGIKFKDDCRYSHLNRSTENPRTEREESQAKDQALFDDFTDRSD